MNEPELADAGSFDVVPIALPNYIDPANDALPRADAETVAISEVFGDFGGRLVEWTVPGDRRSIGPTFTRLQKWANPPEPRSSVLLWLGHGRSDEDAAVLVVNGGPDSDEDHEL